jgi:shikimate dehydrogenase
MTDRPPAVIVSLPATSAEAARQEIAEAAAAGADLAEVRFDLWEPGELAHLGLLFPSPLPLLATYRSRAEGGRAPDDAGTRAVVLRELLQHPFRWIDLEADRDRAVLDETPASERLGRIVSTHRPTGARPGEWQRWVREPPMAGTVRKVVVRAGVGEALLSLLPALPPPGESSLVAMTVGPSGPLLRALARQLGFPFVFAALPEGPPGNPPRPPVEASQIPVDRLRSYLAAGPGAPIYALVGHPVAHSLSPAIHSRWMQRRGQAGLYLALDLANEKEFLEVLAPLASWGFRGLNVTHPFKRIALEAASDIGPGARVCGVANCLTFRPDEVAAENTDLLAILRRLGELREAGRWDGQSLSVVGAGGAARATLAAARELGAAARIYGRDPERVRRVAQEFGATPALSDEGPPCPLVVHATDVGRAGSEELAVPLGKLVGPGTHLIDWVYRPDHPVVRETAERSGGTYEDGTRLLVYQAAATFGLWWGEEPSEADLRRVLQEEGCAA